MATSRAQFLAVRRRARGRGTVLGKLTRELRVVATFPVAFRGALEGAPTLITAVFVLVYVVVPTFAEGLSIYLKYAFAAAVTTCIALIAMAHQRINLSPLFPLAALILSVLGAFSFLYSILVAPGTSTYSSALIPLIVVALPLLIASHGTRIDGGAVTEYLFKLFGLASLVHVLLQLADFALGLIEAGSYMEQRYFMAAMVLVNFMILCGLFLRNLLLVLSIALIGLSLVIRPSSMLAFSAMFAAGIIILHRLRCRRFLRFACVFLAGAIILGNLAMLRSEEVADAVASLEPLVKKDALGSNSNNVFRLAIIRAVRDEMAEQSVWVGKAFAGDVAVDAKRYMPWLEPGQEIQPIHSDFITMVQQGGLIGYGLFAALFIGMARLCSKGARLAHSTRDVRSETLFDALQAMTIVFMLYMSGNPMMQVPECTLPYLMLVPLSVFLARAQPRFFRGEAAKRTNREPVASRGFL